MLTQFNGTVEQKRHAFISGTVRATKSGLMTIFSNKLATNYAENFVLLFVSTSEISNCFVKLLSDQNQSRLLKKVNLFVPRNEKKKNLLTAISHLIKIFNTKINLL